MGTPGRVVSHWDESFWTLILFVEGRSGVRGKEDTGVTEMDWYGL